MPKDACYRKVKARYRVFPSAYASGTGGKKKAKKKATGGVVTMNNGGAVTRAKRPSSNKNVARGCGIVMSNKRKATKYS